MVTSACTINTESRTPGYSCLSKKDLQQVAKALSVKISDKKTTHESIKKKIGLPESQWYRVAPIPRDIKCKLKFMLYKPKGPGKEYAWLDNIQITKVMSQYSYYLKKNGVPFKFYNTVSADYFTKNPKKVLDVKEIAKKNNVGIIFNTSPEDKPGSHWVSVLIKPSTLEFFDSNGKKPNVYIKNFIDQFDNHVKKINTKEYQKKDGTCGMWAMVYLLKTVLNAKVSKDTDKTVNSLRRTFFI